MNTTDRPAFRPAWTAGARAYPEADTFEAAKEGFKRKRKNVMFHMPNTGEAGNQTCVICDGLLKDPARAISRDMGNNTRVEHSAAKNPDQHSTWYYLAKEKLVVGGMHYICSWSNLLGKITADSRSF